MKIGVSHTNSFDLSFHVIVLDYIGKQKESGKKIKNKISENNRNRNKNQIKHGA